MMRRRPSNYVPQEADEALAEARKLAAGHLAGTIVRPTPMCLACGHHAVVKELTLQMDEGRGMTGTAVGIMGALCIENSKECGCTTVQDGEWRQGHNWRYGTERVWVVRGIPYAIKDMPFNFTDKQRQRMEEFLAATDPGKRAA